MCVQLVRPTLGAILFAILVLCLAQTAQATDSKNRMWLVWEHQSFNPRLCAELFLCDPIKQFIPRLINEPPEDEARALIGSMDQLANAREMPVDHPDAPEFCAFTDEVSILGFEAESWPISEKLAALRGLEGVYIDVSGLKAPPGYPGDFGADLQSEVVNRFTDAGIPLLSEDIMEITPGKPHLNIYFSNTNPDTGCWFSVFASLTQTMLLTRNHTIKVKAGSWGFSGGYSADHPLRSEYEAILIVLDKFISDFKDANPDGLRPKI